MPQSRVRTTASVARAIRSTALVTLTGTATRAPGTASLISATDAEQQLLGLEDVAGVVDHDRELALGVDHEPEVAARHAHELGEARHLRVAHLGGRRWPTRCSRTG